jgi:hypothetical protein
MKLFACTWPNGEISFVLARDPADAVDRLDEFGTAEEKWLYPVEKDFMVTFVHQRETEAHAQAQSNGTGAREFVGWSLSEVGDAMDERLEKLRVLTPEGDDEDEDEDEDGA